MTAERVHNRIVTGCLVLLMALFAKAAFAQTQIKPGFNLFSVEQDQEIGRQSALEAERQLPILHDRSIETYVNAIGKRLAAAAPGAKYPYQFKVVNASDINAFALPGGSMYVNRGLMEAAGSEGQLAGVMAHEMAHVALRHGTNGLIVNHYEPFGGDATERFGGSAGFLVSSEEPVEGPTSLARASDDLLGQIQRTNPNLRMLSSSERSTTMDGAPALSFVLSGRSLVTGEEERVTLFTRELPDDHVIYAIFIAPEQAYDGLKETFQRMFQSLRVSSQIAHR